jgi:hypothetical protein
MNLFGYEISVNKKAPGGPGAVPAQSLTTDAARLSGHLENTGSLIAAPAAGTPPDPGPLPLAPAHGPGDLRWPLRYDFPYAANQLWTPRRTLTPFGILRQIADVDDISRICIETRKDQICSLNWDIVAKDKQKDESVGPKVKAIKAFFLKPDKRRSFSTWLRAAIEEVLVIDALSIYRRRTRGGELYSLELKDGTTFLPLLDTNGDTPAPPSVAYRQIIKGQPVEGGDCTVDDLFYRPRTVRNHTPYGLSAVESILLTINAALNRAVFNLQYYVEGNIPEGLLEAPKGFTTKQLIEFQTYLDDYLSGDLGKRRRIKVVHEGGSKVFQFKEPDFATTYDEWLLKVRCAAFGVPPQEIGFTQDVNRATGKMQENVTYRRGVKPLSIYFKELFDDVIALDMGAPELEWIWSGGEQEDKLLQAKVDQIYVNIGKTSVDELRARDGQEAIGMGPYVQTSAGPVFVEDLLTAPPDEDPNNSEAHNPGATGGAGNDKKPTDKKPADAAAVSEAAIADLKKWRAVAIKAVKAKKPIREFASEAIPLELHTRIEQFLKLAGDHIGKVVAAFDLAIADYQIEKKAGGEARQLTRIEQRAAKAYKRLFEAHFKAQGKDLVEHIKKGLERHAS